MSKQGSEPWQQAAPPTSVPLAEPPFVDHDGASNLSPVPGTAVDSDEPPALLFHDGPGYDPGPDHHRGSKRRPNWGIGEVLMVIPIMGIVLALSFAIMVVLAALEGTDLEDLTSGGMDNLPPSMLIVPTLVQQLAWFGWPFVVSKLKGLGPARDWGWAFKPVDLAIGIGTAFIAMFAAALIGAGVGFAVGLEDNTAAQNTQVLTGMKDSPWLYGLLFIVVIGAPFSEEVLFRGLVMRAFQKRWGVVAGVAASILSFVPLHLADGGVFSAGQLVLWATIGTLGGILAAAALMTRRLAAPIVAHILINAFGAAAALGAFDSFIELSLAPCGGC